MKGDNDIAIKELFRQTTGCTVSETFGAPFVAAFSKYHKADEEQIIAAAYCCSLFLSCILAGFPTNRMHTFVHCAREQCSRFLFNCKMYDTLFSNIPSQLLDAVVLLNSECCSILRTCKKEDIYEAFDFYTNG